MSAPRQFSYPVLLVVTLPAALLAFAAATVQFNAYRVALETLDVTTDTLPYVTVAVRLSTFLLTTVCVAALGYWVGDQVDVGRSYAGLAASLFLATLAGFLVAVAVTRFLLADPQGSVASLVSAGTTVTLDSARAALVGLAGAAVGQFRRADGDDAEPSTAAGWDRQ